MSAHVVESAGVLGGRGTGRSTLTALTQRRRGRRRDVENLSRNKNRAKAETKVNGEKSLFHIRVYGILRLNTCKKIKYCAMRQ